jgi:hypothetical protein
MRLQRDNTFTRWPGAFSVPMCLNVIVFWKWMRWTTEPSLITTYGRFHMSIFRQDDKSTPKPCLPTCGYLPTYSSICIYPSTHLPIYLALSLSLPITFPSLLAHGMMFPNILGGETWGELENPNVWHLCSQMPMPEAVQSVYLLVFAPSTRCQSQMSLRFKSTWRMGHGKP